MHLLRSIYNYREVTLILAIIAVVEFTVSKAQEDGSPFLTAMFVLSAASLPVFQRYR